MTTGPPRSPPKDCRGRPPTTGPPRTPMREDRITHEIPRRRADPGLEDGRQPRRGVTRRGDTSTNTRTTTRRAGGGAHAPRGHAPPPSTARGHGAGTRPQPTTIQN